MGGEDRGLVGVGSCLSRSPGLELHHGAVEGIVEQAALLVRVGGVLLDLDVLVEHPQDPADAEAGRGRHAEQDVRVLGAPARFAAGCRCGGRLSAGVRDRDDALLAQPYRRASTSSVAAWAAPGRAR